MKAKVKILIPAILMFLLILLFAIYLICGNMKKEKIEQDTEDYSAGMKTCIEELISESEYRELIPEFTVKVNTSLEKTPTLNSTYGTLNQKYYIYITISDIFDEYSFSEQYDIAYNLIELIKNCIRENEKNFRLFNYWLLKENENRYCKANGIAMIFKKWDFVYSIKTTHNRYSTTQNGTFDINGTTYSGNEFNEKYGQEINSEESYSTFPTFPAPAPAPSESIRCWYCSQVIYYDGTAIHSTHKIGNTYTCDYCGKENIIK